MLEDEHSSVYNNSLIWAKSQRHKAKRRPFPVLLTDIDNTFYKPETEKEMWQLYHRLQTLNWGLVYLTGRSRELVEGIETLPRFDVLAVSLGSEIYVLQLDGSYLPDYQCARIFDKNFAVLYLRKKLGFSGIVAGDGAVDYSMIFESGLPAIVVGGAEPVLRHRITSLRTVDEKIRVLPNGNLLFVGDDVEDLAARGIANALFSGFYKM